VSHRRAVLGAFVGIALSACGETAPPTFDDASGGAATSGSSSGGATASGGTGGASGVSGGLGGTATGGNPTAGGGGGGAGNEQGGMPAAGSSPGGASATGGVSGATLGGVGGGGGATAGGTGGSVAGASGAAGKAGAGNGGSGGKAGTGGSGGGGATANITLWIAGDSTVATGGPCPIGWGGVFDPLFNDRVSVTNSAVGGRSVRTWLYNVATTMDSTGECELARDASGNPTIQSRWQAMLTGMKAGDYLFIQFGINDGSATCDRHVGLAAFKESYGMMAQAAKDRGAQPIFLTPVSSIACNGSTARGTRGSYVTATQEAGTQYNVPVIDLHALSVALYTMRGFCPIPGGSDVSASTGGAVGEFFCDDHTHFDTPGATAIAGLVAGALRTQNIPLAAYLR
jgi:lysophospholipase L1-like esterase